MINNSNVTNAIYTIASEFGHKDAMFDLAELYHEGKHVKKNLKKAFELHKQLADQDNVAAILNIAGFYEQGLVVDKDISMAIAHYMKIIKMNESIDFTKVNKLISEYKDHKEIEIPFFRYIKSKCAICSRSDVRRAVYFCKCFPKTKICCECFLSDNSDDGACPCCDDYMYR